MRDHGATLIGLTRLAGLDSRSPLRGHALLAEREGVAIAAIALTSGAVVADPFHATTDALTVLRQRRYGLVRQGADVGPVRTLMRRLAPQPIGVSMELRSRGSSHERSAPRAPKEK